MRVNRFGAVSVEIFYEISLFPSNRKPFAWLIILTRCWYSRLKKKWGGGAVGSPLWAHGTWATATHPALWRASVTGPHPTRTSAPVLLSFENVGKLPIKIWVALKKLNQDNQLFNSYFVDRIPQICTQSKEKHSDHPMETQGDKTALDTMYHCTSGAVFPLPCPKWSVTDMIKPPCQLWKALCLCLC